MPVKTNVATENDFYLRLISFPDIKYVVVPVKTNVATENGIQSQVHLLRMVFNLRFISFPDIKYDAAPRETISKT